MSERDEQMYRLSDNHPSIPKEENRCAFVSTNNSSLASALYIPPKKAISANCARCAPLARARKWETCSANSTGSQPRLPQTLEPRVQ
ncbi:hypothetical protein IEO21_02918 [Rhodonia placenta]|uniref:Uncharacterized protein n=1 Tax=Rhodonia placenta TaxID=104341 RepID=A0A8H7P6S1_9APHY|nr:hypothetical protein IEO21_02918 [Postia placenta]